MPDDNSFEYRQLSNVVVSAVPAASAALFVAAGGLLDSTELKKLALAGAMLAATWVPAGTNLSRLLGSEHSVAAHQRILALANASMVIAVVLMQMGAAKDIGSSAESKIAPVALSSFGASSLIAVLYHAARSTDRIEAKPLVELISAALGLLGSILFMAVQVLAYIGATDEAKKHAAMMLQAAVAGFIVATGYGTLQAYLAYRDRVSADVETADNTAINHEGQTSSLLPETTGSGMFARVNYGGANQGERSETPRNFPQP